MKEKINEILEKILDIVIVLFWIAIGYGVSLMIITTILNAIN